MGCGASSCGVNVAELTKLPEQPHDVTIAETGAVIHPKRDTRLRVGKWLNSANGSFEVVEKDDGLFLEVWGMGSSQLVEDGEYFSTATARNKIGPSNDELIFQLRPPSGEWADPLFAIRDGAVTAGTFLVTWMPTPLWEDTVGSDTSHQLGIVGAGTLVEAAGPPAFSDGGTRRIPIKPSGALQMSHLRMQEGENSPWAEFIPGKTRPVEGQKYMELASINEALECKDTVLLKGSWMKLRAEEGSILPRRQDLPAESSWEPFGCMRLVARYRVRMIAISYCWVKPEHPDPTGEQLQHLSKAISLRLQEEKLPLQDMAIFFDWCSLFQKERTEEQLEIFKRSLKNVNLWYAHEMVMCWLLTAVPAGVLAYDQRGWPTFERGVSCFIKDGSKVLDLGLMQDTCMNWWSLLTTCKAGRLPPMAAAKFGAILESKKFTNGADCDLVKKKYTETFQDVLATTSQLNFSSLNWGAKEFAVLAEALPACLALQRLELGANAPGKDGVKALAAAMPQCSNLMELYLHECQITDEDAVCIFESATRCPKISVISVNHNDISSSGVVQIAKLCCSIPILFSLRLRKANVGTEGAAGIVEMICKCTSLTYLDMSNDIPPNCQGDIHAAWVAAGKDERALCFD